MPLIQITDAYNEPLDLWLSPNHEGQTRFVRESDVPKVVTDEANLAQDGDERLPEDAADEQPTVKRCKRLCAVVVLRRRPSFETWR